MVYTYTPAYYSSLQDSIASLCRSVLPFSSRGRRRLPAEQQEAARRHAEALKWQQESFHRILHLAGLHREGIVPASEVAAFRATLLDALVALPPHPEPPAVVRDKLLFLQELLYAKCISAEEYHSSKRPLLHQLAALGIEVDSRDVVAGALPPGSSEEEEWSVIDLRDPAPATAIPGKQKHKTPVRSFVSPWKNRGKKEAMNIPAQPPLASVDQNPKYPPLLMADGSPSAAMEKAEKGKRRPFTALFHSGNENKEQGNEAIGDEQVKAKKKSSWGFDGLKKWKKGGGGREEEEAIAPCLASGERSECQLEARAMASNPEVKRIKKKLHSDTSASDMFSDKVLVENTRKELSRIQEQLSVTNRNLKFSDEQIESISTRLPIDKSELTNFFPKAWCDQHGDVVINIVKKEFKEHVEEMETKRDTTGHENWVAFEEGHENFNPRVISSRHQTALSKEKGHKSSTNSDYFTNPFDDENNPFWDPSFNS